MINILKNKTILGALFFVSISDAANANTTISAEGQYIFNTLGFYIGGVLVAFMAAGFCMLESGLVTTKSVSTIAAKNIGKFAICSKITGYFIIKISILFFIYTEEFKQMISLLLILRKSACGIAKSHNLRKLFGKDLDAFMFKKR